MPAKFDKNHISHVCTIRRAYSGLNKSRILASGAAGLIYALYNGTIRFNQGFTAGLIAFTAAVMGGIGNLKGAVVGGLIIGVIQAISDSGDYLGLALGPQWTPAVVFGVLILVMVFRPQGLFGEETREG